MSEESDLLREIANKLDTLIAVQKLSSAETIQRLKNNIDKDKIARAVLVKSESPISYGSLVEEVARESGASERTVKRRIAELAEQGLIRSMRTGNQSSYESTGIL